MQKSTQPLLIGLTGNPGVGKTTVARSLDSIPADSLVPERADRYHAMRAVNMRNILGWHGYSGENSALRLREYHKEIRERGETDQLLGRLLLHKSSIIVVDSIRHATDAEYFQTELEGMLIGLNAPLPVCKQRFFNDVNDSKHFDLPSKYKKLTELTNGDKIDTLSEKFRSAAWDVECEEIYDEGMGIATCIERADVVVDAVQSIDMITRNVLGHIRQFAVERI